MDHAHRLSAGGNTGQEGCCSSVGARRAGSMATCRIPRPLPWPRCSIGLSLCVTPVTWPARVNSSPTWWSRPIRHRTARIIPRCSAPRTSWRGCTGRPATRAPPVGCWRRPSRRPSVSGRTPIPCCWRSSSSWRPSRTSSATDTRPAATSTGSWPPVRPRSAPTIRRSARRGPTSPRPAQLTAPIPRALRTPRSTAPGVRGPGWSRRRPRMFDGRSHRFHRRPRRLDRVCLPILPALRHRSGRRSDRDRTDTAAGDGPDHTSLGDRDPRTAPPTPAPHLGFRPVNPRRTHPG